MRVMKWIVAVGLVGVSPRMAIAAETPDHCKAGEKRVFSCKTEKKDKVLSLCLNGSTLYYRFGQLSKVELEYPSGKLVNESAYSLFKRRRWGWKWGDVEEVSFTVGANTFTVSGARGDGSAASVVVTQKEREIVNISCLGEADELWSRLDKVLPASVE